MLASLVGWKAAIRRPQAEGKGRIRVDVLTHPEGTVMVIVRNLTEAQTRTAVVLPDVSDRRLIELFSGRPLMVSKAEGGGRMTLELGPGEVLVYRG
jgi:hypothetical protein